jgi:hypothetical protein
MSRSLSAAVPLGDRDPFDVLHRVEQPGVVARTVEHLVAANR